MNLFAVEKFIDCIKSDIVLCYINILKIFGKKPVNQKYSQTDSFIKGQRISSEGQLEKLFYGIDNFNKAEWTISSMAQEIGRQKGIRGAAAHNTWVQIGAELGVTGFVLWISLIF